MPRAAHMWFVSTRKRPAESARTGTGSYPDHSGAERHDPRDPSSAIAPLELHDDVDDAGHIMDDVFAAKLGPRLQDDQRKLFDRAFRTVGMDSGEGARVAGVDRTKEC